MKAAEEWEIALNDENQEGTVAEVAIRVIRQIQLDAMKEGMRRAAQVALKQQTGSALTLHHYMMCEEAILSASEQLTEKDL